MTLDELGAAVGVAGSQLSLIENGKREPKLSLLQAVAEVTGTAVSDLISHETALAVIRDKLGKKKPEFLRMNLKAYELGRKEALAMSA